MTQSPLTRCPNCGTTLTFGNVVGQHQIDDGMLAVGLVCQRCHMASHLKVGRSDWERMSGGQKRPKEVPPSGGGSTSPDLIDLRQVGRTVQGFARVDLAPIVDVSDLELLWDYQERTAVGSIPKEVLV